MATFYVLNNKKYRTSVRLRDGRLEAIRFEPEVYFGGIGQSTYTTSDPEVIEALKKHYAYGTTFWEKEPPAEADTSAPNDIPVDLEALLPDPDNAIREETVTSVASARAWLQANLDYVIPAGMKKDDIKIEAAKRNVLFIQW